MTISFTVLYPPVVLQDYSSSVNFQHDATEKDAVASKKKCVGISQIMNFHESAALSIILHFLSTNYSRFVKAIITADIHIHQTTHSIQNPIHWHT